MNKENKTASRNPALDALMDEITPLDSLKTDDRMNTAIRIFDLVKEKGWSKKLFAEKMKKEPSVISKWFSGTHNFTLDTLTEIRDVLGVTLDDLVREKTPDLVFKTQFLAGVADVKPYYGGGPATMISSYPHDDHIIFISVDAEYPTQRIHGHLEDLSAAIGMSEISRAGHVTWRNVSKCMWAGNILTQGSFRIKAPKYDESNENNAALKV